MPSLASRAPSRPASRLTRPLLALMLLSAFSFAAITTVAWGAHFHTTCVPHGFVHGDVNYDGSFFARVDAGCGGTARRCGIYSYNSFRGDQTVSGGSTCNAWSRTFGDYTECASHAQTYYSGVFSSHAHQANNWCA